MTDDEQWFTVPTAKGIVKISKLCTPSAGCTHHVVWGDGSHQLLRSHDLLAGLAQHQYDARTLPLHFQQRQQHEQHEEHEQRERNEDEPSTLQQRAYEQDDVVRQVEAA